MTKAVAVEVIATKIFVIRGKRVMLDSDLASLYGVETKVLLQSLKRNIKRFPDDFMFQTTKEEFVNLRSQFVTSNRDGRRYYFPSELFSGSCRGALLALTRCQAPRATR